MRSADLEVGTDFVGPSSAGPGPNAVRPYQNADLKVSATNRGPAPHVRAAAHHPQPTQPHERHIRAGAIGLIEIVGEPIDVELIRHAALNGVRPHQGLFDHVASSLLKLPSLHCHPEFRFSGRRTTVLRLVPAGRTAVKRTEQLVRCHTGASCVQCKGSFVLKNGTQHDSAAEGASIIPISAGGKESPPEGCGRAT
jgi:hypothetical protein